MKRVTAGLAAAAAIAGFGGAAAAQPGAQAPAGLTLAPAEQGALLPLKQAVDARNWAAAAALAPAARAAARSADARYVLSRLELETAIGTGNRQAQTQAISAALATRRASDQEQAELLRQYAAISYESGGLDAAQSALERALNLSPQDPETLSMLAQLTRNRGNATQALGYFQRALRAAEAAGRRLPESRYRLALAMAEQAGQRGVALEIARQFISAYPTPGNWRDVLMVFRTTGTVDASQNLDAMRLMRASGALAGERDYLGLAQALEQAQLPAEAKAVLDEGVSRKMVAASDAAPRELLRNATTRATAERGRLTAQIAEAQAPTATGTQARTVGDTLLSHGRYAEAATAYRTALTRPGEDPGLVNTRLGIALAMAGQRAEAEAAFRAATGPRAELAALWAIWLTQRPAA